MGDPKPRGRPDRGAKIPGAARTYANRTSDLLSCHRKSVSADPTPHYAKARSRAPFLLRTDWFALGFRTQPDRGYAEGMSEATETLIGAFPKDVRQAAAEVTRVFEGAGATCSPDSFGIKVSGEGLSIPARIYVEERRVMMGEGLARHLADCLLTRHHDGYVRARALARIISLNKPWSIPFVVQLIGEYVVEILVIYRRQLRRDRSSFAGGVRRGKYRLHPPNRATGHQLLGLLLPSRRARAIRWLSPGRAASSHRIEPERSIGYSSERERLRYRTRTPSPLTY